MRAQIRQQGPRWGVTDRNNLARLTARPESAEMPCLPDEGSRITAGRATRRARLANPLREKN